MRLLFSDFFAQYKKGEKSMIKRVEKKATKLQMIPQENKESKHMQTNEIPKRNTGVLSKNGIPSKNEPGKKLMWTGYKQVQKSLQEQRSENRSPKTQNTDEFYKTFKEN